MNHACSKKFILNLYDRKFGHLYLRLKWFMRATGMFKGFIQVLVSAQATVTMTSVNLSQSLGLPHMCVILSRIILLYNITISGK